MSHNKHILITAILALTVILGCSRVDGQSMQESQAEPDGQFTSTTVMAETNSSAVIELNVPQLSDIDLSEIFAYDREDADTSADQAQNLVLEDRDIIIDRAGSYLLTGSIGDGQLTIDVASDEQVHLILNGVNIHNSSSAAIYVANADKVIITLMQGSVNSLSDGSEYIFESPDEDEPDAVIFSHDDLSINGSGRLVIDANYNNAIASKDDLLIIGADISITSVDDGLIGKDSLVIIDSTIELDVMGDALKSTEDEDSDKGYTAISAGELTIEAGDDGIRAVTLLLLESGTISIDSEGDSINSDNIIQIINPDLILASGDDAIHADVQLDIYGGTMEVSRSYEALESQTINIYGGDMDLISSDDGINAAGDGGRTVSYLLNIEGGYIRVNASGDGLDANGNITMSGGYVYVDGPNSSWNGMLDYDGNFRMTGGSLVTSGNAGMFQAPSADSTVRSLVIGFDSVQPAGTTVELLDSNSQVITSLTPAKQFQVVMFSLPDINDGESFTVQTSSQSVSVNSTDLVSYGGNMNAQNARGRFPRRR